MDQGFSWRKVLEATIIITIIYAVSSPIFDNSLDPISMLKVIGPFAVLYALSSKVLEKFSGEEKEEENVEYY